jgi:hypothetical protein
LICVEEIGVTVNPLGALVGAKVVAATSGPVTGPPPGAMALIRYVYPVDGGSPVLLYELELAAIVANTVQSVPDVGRLSIRYPVSFVAASVHFRLICVDEKAVALTPVGTAVGPNVVAATPAALTRAPPGAIAEIT